VSKLDVLIEAGSPLKAGSLIKVGGGAEVTCSNRSWGASIRSFTVSKVYFSFSFSSVSSGSLNNSRGLTLQNVVR